MIFNFFKKIKKNPNSASEPIEKLSLKKMEEELKEFDFEKSSKSKKI